jgi:hypothetical protein
MFYFNEIQGRLVETYLEAIGTKRDVIAYFCSKILSFLKTFGTNFMSFLNTLGTNLFQLVYNNIVTFFTLFMLSVPIFYIFTYLKLIFSYAGKV